MENSNIPIPQCPLPIDRYPQVLLGHGSGGKLTRQIIDELIRPAFDNPILSTLHDGAILDGQKDKIAFSTDSYVVRPLFFPGGNIGSLSIHGTVNDLAMCGASPKYLSVSLIIEEGLSFKTLWEIICHMKDAAKSSGIQIVTGDTKVVERGKGDGIYINTTGIGVLGDGVHIDPKNIKPGDAIILSRDIANHGIAVLSEREGLSFESQIQSDSMPLHNHIQELLNSKIEIHCLRDLTRGGLTGGLVELADSGGLGFEIEEKSIHVNDPVQGACEMLGLDPFYVANEGCFLVVTPQNQSEKVLSILNKYPGGEYASQIGVAVENEAKQVLLKTDLGTARLLDLLSGEQLPRIC